MAKKTADATVIIRQNDEDLVPKEILAKSIVEISNGVKKLSDSGLNRRAIEVLVHDSSRVSMTDVRKVLDALQTLAKDYTNG